MVARLGMQRAKRGRKTELKHPIHYRLLETRLKLLIWFTFVFLNERCRYHPSPAFIEERD